MFFSFFSKVALPPNRSLLNYEEKVNFLSILFLQQKLYSFILLVNTKISIFFCKSIFYFLKDEDKKSSHFTVLTTFYFLFFFFFFFFLTKILIHLFLLFVFQIIGSCIGQSPPSRCSNENDFFIFSSLPKTQLQLEF